MLKQRTQSALVLSASCLGMLAVGANGTAIMSALPTIQRDLGLDATARQWAVNAYLVVSAACIIVGGKAADLAGAHRVSMLGLMLFGIASCMVATADSPAALLSGRALQGLAAALAVPGTLAAARSAVEPERQPSAIGAWTGFLMLGFSLGPLLGGTLTHFVSWRAVFWFNALAMLTAAAGLLLPARGEVASPSAGRATGFDGVGFLLFAMLIASLIFALGALPEVRSAPVAFAIPFALAGAALLGLLQVEHRVRAPLLDLSFFTRAQFVRGMVLGALSMFSILTLLLYFNLEAQGPAGLGFTAIGAGLILLPMSAGLLVCAFAAPDLTARFGLRTALTAGMLLTIIASAVIAAAGAAPVLLAGGLFAIGAGLAVPYATAPRLALSVLAPSQAGQGAGIINACTFLGGSLGVACGDIAFALGGFAAVMALIGVTGFIGVWLCRGLAGAA
jgi:MFS family permease